MIKGGNGTRYGDVGVAEYVRSFCDEITELDLPNIVDRCDKVAASMAEEAPALFLDDDLAPVSGSGESDIGDESATPAI